MKIVCIGRNYADHISELKNERPSEPVIFMKPDTALLKSNEPFYYPKFSQNIHFEVEVVLRICKPAKLIEKEHAHAYFDQIGLGIDFTARDLQKIQKEKGLPWEIAKAFNGSAPISSFHDKQQFDLGNLNFSLTKNGESQQKGNTSHMLFAFNEVLAYISKFIELKTGDLIFTGTPAGVGSVQIGDKLEAFLEEEKVLETEIK